jgi:SHS family lactate transporter-like MFS transporter
MSDLPSDKKKPFGFVVDPVEADERMSAGRYLLTRLPTLKPPMNKAPNPFSLLATLNFQQWMFFLV